MARQKAKVGIYVLRDTASGKFYAGSGHWAGPLEARKWVPRVSADEQDDAEQYDDADIAESFPGGLPEGWEKVLLYYLDGKKAD